MFSLRLFKNRVFRRPIFLVLACVLFFISFSFASVLHHHDDLKEHDDCFVCTLTHALCLDGIQILCLAVGSIILGFVFFYYEVVYSQSYFTSSISRAPPVSPLL